MQLREFCINLLSMLIFSKSKMFFNYRPSTHIIAHLYYCIRGNANVGDGLLQNASDHFCKKSPFFS